MKKSYKVVMGVLALIVVTCLLSIPITFLMESAANASQGGSDKANINGTYTDEAGEDYIFIVLENDDVPLAAAPTIARSHNAVLSIVGLSLVAMLSLAYISWYSMVRHNINSYSYLIPNSELKALIPAKSFVHPRELSRAEYEVQYRAANRYI